VSDSTRRSVALFGATGLVGKECLRLLEHEPTVERVAVFVRRALPTPPASKVTVHVIDFEQPDTWREQLAVDQVFCALGTTIKQAGSQLAFRRVDYHYPLEIARLAVGQGAKHFLLVSALGANAHSRIFYSRVKGELEDKVMALPFRSVTIVRPSLLVGERKEVRRGEKIGEFLSFLAPTKYKPVRGGDVAAALVSAARDDAAGRESSSRRRSGNCGAPDH
jgi:uncharacterized protein YbjT (DUF2867 family)